MPGICPRCLREVYFAEEKLALGKVWHNFCFTCRNCRKLLDSWTVATHSGELFCCSCYNRLFSITSVRASLPPPINHIFPPADTKDLGALSPCDSLSDCCCCCYCNEENPLIDPQNQDSGIRESSISPIEKRRLRGGGGEDEEVPESLPAFETGDGKRCSENESCNLGGQNSVNTVCNSPSSPTAVTAWYTKHESTSQSAVSRPSSAKRALIRPSSTPASAQSASIVQASGNTCSAQRRPGSPCRANCEHHQYSNQYHRYHCHDSQSSDRVQSSQERSKIIREERHLVQNCRKHLSHCGRSRSSFLLRTQRKASILKPTVKNSIIIDPSRPKSSYPPLPPHYSPPPSRRRVSFQAGEGPFSEDTAVGHPAMRNIVDGGGNNVDIISFEHSAYQDDDDIINDNDHSPRIHADNDGESCDGRSEYESCDDGRMRGGCGGGGGSSGGCCCSGARTNVTLHYPSQSACGKRYQGDRSSTVEGACGCSGRARSGCGSGNAGGCCSTGSSPAPRTGGCCGGGIEGSNEGACASKDPCARRPTGSETCPPRSPDSCSSDPSTLSPCSAVACSPPCAGRKTCCPPAGCRPVRRRIARCNTPCTGDTQSCGGGGCCGSGCRGGCGKPGQTCLPLRPCTIPPCKPHPRGGGSPCMPPKRCAPQPPCCRSPVLPGSPVGMSGNFGGSGCCRSPSPVCRSAGGGGCAPIPTCQQQDDGFLDDSCCFPKLPTGCECLGGGQNCQRCGRKVYQAEMQIASGVPYHNICFSCFCCRKPLETLTYHENCGEIYCKQCYVRNFGPQGYGYAGVLQTPM